MKKYIVIALVLMCESPIRAANFCYKVPGPEAGANQDNTGNAMWIKKDPAIAVATTCAAGSSGLPLGEAAPFGTKKQWNSGPTPELIGSTSDNKHCWCALVYPAIGPWVRTAIFNSTDECLYNCAYRCALQLHSGLEQFTTPFFSDLVF